MELRTGERQILNPLSGEKVLNPTCPEAVKALTSLQVFISHDISSLFFVLIVISSQFLSFENDGKTFHQNCKNKNICIYIFF